MASRMTSRVRSSYWELIT